MPTVSFKINSKNYSIDCAVGQEEKIAGIAVLIDSKVKQLMSMFGSIDNETLFLMVCILTFGDVDKLKLKIADMERQMVELKKNNLSDTSFDEEIISDELINMAKKVKSLSDSISIDV